MLDQRNLAPHAIARFAAETPDVIALQHVEGDGVSYADLDHQCREWAVALGALGLAAETHVGTMLTNTFHAHRTMVALGWLRAIEVPLNTALVGNLLHYALDLADVTALVTERRFVEAITEVLDRLPLLRTIVVVDDPDPGLVATANADSVRLVGRSQIRSAADQPPTDLAGPVDRDIAALLFTSGTTGPSKAVICPWAVVYQNWSWVPEDTLAPGDGLYCAMPLFHNSGRGAFNYAMSRGARLVIRDRFSAASFWTDVRAHDCRTAALVGPMTALLWSAPQADDDGENPLRNVILGPMIPEMEQFERRFGVRVATTYGQTEIGCPLASGWDHGPYISSGKVRTDYPWPEIILANEFDEPVGAGEVGEMLVRTGAPWAMNVGYYKMAAQTAAAWRNGWFHTGDAFTCDADGHFVFLDRMKDTIRRRGENISSFEVENLVGEHPDVTSVAAVGVPAEFGGDEVMVIITVADAEAFDRVAFIADLVERMPRYMVPRYVDVVAELPRNETSLRVKKSELREQGVTAATWDREAAGITIR